MTTLTFVKHYTFAYKKIQCQEIFYIFFSRDILAQLKAPALVLTNINKLLTIFSLLVTN